MNEAFARKSLSRAVKDLIKRSAPYRVFDRARLMQENGVLFSDQSTPQRDNLAHQLRHEVKALPPLNHSGAGDSGSFWTENRMRLRRAMLEQDPIDFLTWEIIRETIFGGGGCYAEELNALDDRLLQAARETRVGLPKRCVHDKRTSGAMVRHGYHISQFERHAGVQIGSINSVFEFGGGYGGMCRLLHNLGFLGNYVIFDFPELHALQRYYLGMHGIGPYAAKKGAGKGSITFLTDIAGLDALPVPDSRTSLFIGTWSISETPEQLRRQVFAHPVVSSIGNFIIAYQNRFFEVDNQGFFSEIRATFTAQHWEHYEIKHFSDNYYLIGSSQGSHVARPAGKKD